MLIGRIERPARIDSAEITIAQSVNRPPSMKIYQLNRFSRGKARSRAPIISGTRKLPSTAGDRRDQEEQDHDHAVHREQLVVGLGLQRGRPAASSDRAAPSVAAAPPTKKKNVIVTMYKDGDPFVVVRQAATTCTL